MLQIHIQLSVKGSQFLTLLYPSNCHMYASVCAIRHVFTRKYTIHYFYKKTLEFNISSRGLKHATIIKVIALNILSSLSCIL